jgi:hypothetical protein
LCNYLGANLKKLLYCDFHFSDSYSSIIISWQNDFIHEKFVDTLIVDINSNYSSKILLFRLGKKQKESTDLKPIFCEQIIFSEEKVVKNERCYQLLL